MTSPSRPAYEGRILVREQIDFAGSADPGRTGHRPGRAVGEHAGREQHGHRQRDAHLQRPGRDRGLHGVRLAGDAVNVRANDRPGRADRRPAGSGCRCAVAGRGARRRKPSAGVTAPTAGKVFTNDNLRPDPTAPAPPPAPAAPGNAAASEASKAAGATSGDAKADAAAADPDQEGVTPRELQEAAGVERQGRGLLARPGQHAQGAAGDEERRRSRRCGRTSRRCRLEPAVRSARSAPPPSRRPWPT